MLKVHVGSTLSNKQISAITHLIASAVQDLKIDDVTIVSTDGKPFKLPNNVQENAVSSSLQEYKLETERHLKNSIESLISKFVGIDKVKAEVNVELDLEHLSVDSEIFDPDSQVVRSMQSTEESSNNTDNTGSVLVADNIPNSNTSSESKGNTSAAEKKEETINYEISREIVKK